MLRLNPLRLLARRLDDERDRWFLWVPVGMGAGIAFYFALPFEPPVAVLAATPLLFAAVMLLRHRALAALMLAVPLCMALGFNAAQIETRLVAAPMLDRAIGPGPIAGRLMRIESLPDGSRLTLRAVAIGHLPPAQTPAQIRVKVKQPFDAIPPAGTRLSLWGEVGPLSGPVAPDANDFRRQFYFKGTGGVGWAYGEIRVLPETENPPPTFYERVALLFERARHVLTRHVNAALRGDVGAMTAALLNGQQTGIGQEVMQAMRVSGLVHLLSISGVHVSMMGVLVYFPLRALLALIPFVALRFPIKKIAAAMAILATAAYTMLVGPETPTLRSMLMTSIVMFTIIADRRATSMRLIALSALIVMLIFPDGVMGASFQMSFAAVLAMIAVYEKPLDAALREQKLFDMAGWLGRAQKHFGAIIITSIVATAATTPFTLYHFQSFSFYGVVANMLAIPLTSFWIMPNILLAYLAAPFGWDEAFIVAASWGVAALIAMAQQVAAWPYALLRLPAMPDAAFLAIVCGFLWLCLWRRRWRYAGALPVIIGLAYPLYTAQPDVFIAEDGKQWIARLDDGRFAAASLRREKFVLAQWQQRVGGVALVDAHDLNATEAAAPEDDEPDDDASVAASPAPAAVPTNLRCDALGCVYRHGAHSVAFATQPEATLEDCASATVVVAQIPLPDCAVAIVIDETARRRHGAYSLNFRNDVINVAFTRARRGARPWSAGWGQALSQTAAP